MGPYTRDTLEEREGSLFLRVRAIPGAGRTEVGGNRDGALVVRVGEPPERGRANRAIERALAEALGLPRGALAIASGERAREKRFRVEGIAREELARRLAPFLAS